MFAQFFRIAAWLASGLALLDFAMVSMKGLASSVPFDATERGLLDLATRMARHLPLYDGPPDALAPALMPGFPLAAAIPVEFFGSHLLWLRIISLGCVLAVAIIAMAVVHEETENPTVALASGSILLAGYSLFAGNPAAARPEPLMLLLALGGGLALRSMPGAVGGMIGALMLSAAAFTQPQALWLAVATFVYLTREDRGRLMPFTLGMALCFAGGYVGLSHVLGPWFNYYAWDQPLQALRFDGPGLLQFVGSRLLGTLGVLTVMTVMSFALPTRPWRGPGGLWPCVGLAALAAGLLATQRAVPEPQGLAILVAALALVGPISLHRVSQHLSTWPDSTRMAGEATVLVALVLQFVALFSSLPPSLIFPGA